MSTPTDDRVVLPLSRVREAAEALCGLWCVPYLQPHEPPCLVPLLEERERMLGTAYVGTVSPDCQAAKCTACTGCTHYCHPRPAARTTREGSA